MRPKALRFLQKLCSPAIRLQVQNPSKSNEKLQEIVEKNSDELLKLYGNYKKDSNELSNLINLFMKSHSKEFDKLLRDEVDINLYNLSIV